MHQSKSSKSKPGNEFNKKTRSKSHSFPDVQQQSHHARENPRLLHFYVIRKLRVSHQEESWKAHLTLLGRTLPKGFHQEATSQRCTLPGKIPWPKKRVQKQGRRGTWVLDCPDQASSRLHGRVLDMPETDLLHRHRVCSTGTPPFLDQMLNLLNLLINATALLTI